MLVKGAWVKRSIAAEARRQTRCVTGMALGAIFAIMISSAGAGLAAAVAPQDPIQEARGLVDQAIAILENPHLTLEEERRELRALAEPHFDFEGMARSTLGYHWKTLMPDQRQQFVTLFTAFIEDAALSKIQEYSGQRVEFTRESPIAPGYVQVQGHALTTNRADPIPFTFMCRQVDGRWKVYDLTVDNISVIANYRNQFNRVINDQGFAKLMDVMKQKQVELAALLGTKRADAADNHSSE
jgi:phospholipid transport system substrate-binding protein